ncbi:MAG TPA: hypothetical protein PK323_03320 [Bacteroidia bacterium]|nr:hypothetical protein [Bacteroidia bacterium]
MKYYIFSALVIIYSFTLFSCKTKPVSTSPKNQQTIENTNNNQVTVYPTEPGTCMIQGVLIKLLPNDASLEDEPCKSFPCKGLVVITKCRACGFGISNKPIEGDTLEVKFLHSTVSSDEFKGVYPAKVVLPGLKLDQLFEAQIKIKLSPGEILKYEIANYELIH